jgi:hypothetical protein
MQESSVGKLLKENTCLARCRNMGGWQGGGVGIRNPFFIGLKVGWPLKRFLEMYYLCRMWLGVHFGLGGGGPNVANPA